MFKFFVVASALVSLVSAVGYGGGAGFAMAGGYGGSGLGESIGLSLGGLGGGGGALGSGGGHGGYGHGIVPAAVISNHHIHHYDVPSSGHIIPTTVDVPANMLPVNFVFRSASSIINVANKHEGSHGSFKETNSQDEPHRLVHHVTKPIIQEVHEIISPFRKITQTVEPVHEEIKTMVARHSGHHHQGGYESGPIHGYSGGKMSGGLGGDYGGIGGSLAGGLGGGLGTTLGDVLGKKGAY